MKTVLLVSVFAISISSLFAQHEVFIKSENAIQGYDPVAYFKMGKPTKGKQEFYYAWKDATWLFANAEI